MANYHGKTGNLKFGAAAIANLQNWNLTTVSETDDATSTGDTWKVPIPGLTDFNASASGKSQKALDTTALIGTSASLVLSYDVSGPNWAAAAILTGLTETVSFENNGTISWTFTGNDAAGLVYAAATGVAATGESDAFSGKLMKGTYDLLDADGDSTAVVAFVDMREWSVSLTCDTADATSVHAEPLTNSGRVRVAGFIGGTVTVTTLASVDPVISDGALVTMELHRTQTPADGYYDGNAICTGNTRGVDSSGVDTITYNFILTGLLDLKVA